MDTKTKNLAFIFPIIAGILIGLFVFDLAFGIGLINPKAAVINSVLFILLTLAVWYLYSKITRNDLKKDALTFIPFLILIFFPVRYLIKIPENMSRASNLPSYLLLLISLSLFIGLKAIFFKKKLKPRLKHKKILAILIILYILIFSTLAILKHMSFHSTAYDLAIYDQTVWGYSRGEIITLSVIETPMLGDHVQPILFLIAPFYWIYSSPITLVVLQTIAIALGAIPIYLLTKKILNKNIALVMSLAYLIHPSTQYMNLFDFHPVTLAIPFILFSLYFLEKKRFITSLILLGTAGLCKEHIPLLFITFGIYILIRYKKPALAITSILIGAIWTYINFKVIIPHFSPVGFAYLTDKGMIEIVIEKLLTPMAILTQNMPFLVLLALPIGLGLFVLFSPIILLPIFQIGMTVFFTKMGIGEIVTHRQASILPFVIVSSVYGIYLIKNFLKKHLKKDITNMAAVFILSTAILSFLAYSPFTILHDYNSFNIRTEHVENGHHLLSRIGPDDSVASTNWIMPHLSQRDDAFMLYHFVRWNQTTFNGPPLRMYEAGPPKYLLLDLSEAVTDTRRAGNVKKIADDPTHIINNEDYGILEVRGSWILLQNGISYKDNICKITPLLNKKDYPHLNIRLNQEILKKC